MSAKQNPPLGADNPTSSTVKKFPVVETVLSVQFEPKEAMHTAHLALLWQEYRDAFPKTEERPPLDQAIEQFPAIPSSRMDLKVQTLENMPSPRLWFVNAAGSEMIQVQRDRFIKNWRKETEIEYYPRYSTIRPKFDRDYQIFLAFLEKNGLGAPAINQCEITYVNHIVAGDGWSQHSDLEKLFTFWRSPDVTPPGSAEDLLLHARFVIPDEDGKSIGRLHADVRPALTNLDNRPMYVLTLTARGQIGQNTAFFDVGHRWIIQAFKSLVHTQFHD